MPNNFSKKNVCKYRYELCKRRWKPVGEQVQCKNRSLFNEGCKEEIHFYILKLIRKKGRGSRTEVITDTELVSAELLEVWENLNNSIIPNLDIVILHQIHGVFPSNWTATVISTCSAFTHRRVNSYTLPYLPPKGESLTRNNLLSHLSSARHSVSAH